MRELHLKLRTLSLDNATCPDSERYPFLKEIIALDKKRVQNWDIYDHFIPGTPVIVEENAQEENSVESEATSDESETSVNPNEESVNPDEDAVNPKELTEMPEQPAPVEEPAPSEAKPKKKTTKRTTKKTTKK